MAHVCGRKTGVRGRKRDSGQRTTSDVNGRFVFSALTQAVVSVRASAADHESVTRSVSLTSNALDFNLPESPA